MMLFWIYDRFGKQIGCTSETFVIDPVHKDELNGEDSLTMPFSSCPLEKGQRIVWRDEFAVWHEHIVSQISDAHDHDVINQVAYCENSLVETMLIYLDDVRCRNSLSSQALAKCFAPTRWRVGKAQLTGTKTVSFYHESVYSGFAKILEAWGGEYETEISVLGVGVTDRTVNHLVRRGSDNGLLFTYGFDMDAITRDVSIDDVYTRIHCFGKGLQSTDENGEWTGGYDRKLTFADINGGKDYVEDNDALLYWGIPDGKGGIRHAEGVFDFPDCEDAAELLELGKEKLEEVSKPKVIYGATVNSLADYGLDFKNSRSGDTCYLRDKPLDYRLSGRITCTVRYLLKTAPTELTLGNVTPSIADVLKGNKADLKWLKDHASAWDDAAGAQSYFLDRLIENLNDYMNMTGGYVYWEQGVGITVYNRPIDDNPDMAIQLNGAGFRIANSKTSDGEWNWRTFGTGDGFVADLLVTGKIIGESSYWNLDTGEILFKQGGIYDLAEKNYWNLTTGEFKLSPGDVKVDDQALDEYIQDNDSFSGAQPLDVFNKLTNNGVVRGITMQGNNLYINADFINTGAFTVKDLFSANKTEGTVTMACFEVENDQLRGANMRLDNKSVIISSETANFDIGELGAGYVSYQGNQYRFIRLNALSNNLIAGISFDRNGTIMGCFSKGKYDVYNGRQISAGWNFYEPLDMHGSQIKNANIASAQTMAIGNSIEDEVTFLAPTKINDDGTIAEYSPVTLGYTNGILTKMVRPKAAEE